MLCCSGTANARGEPPENLICVCSKSNACVGFLLVIGNEAMYTCACIVTHYVSMRVPSLNARNGPSHLICLMIKFTGASRFSLKRTDGQRAASPSKKKLQF
jgi:hypothetical protein